MSAETGLAPAVIVHGLGMARMALDAGRQAGRLPTLLSAPSAGAYAGVGWWRALMALAQAETHILDCGPAAGRALEALRAGQKHLILQADPRIWADIAARAQACRAILYPAPPPALDLGQRAAHRHLAAWLADHAGTPRGDTAKTFG